MKTRSNCACHPARALIAILAAVGGFSVGFGEAIGASGGTDTATTSGEYRGGIFPVRGHHTYGDGLGAGRNHQGQDIMARCGTRLVAARAGRVRYRSYQAGGAGHYLVIRRRGSRSDDVYMHMLRKPLVSRGQRVRRGQRIGRVGSTGRSTACHLHFEVWSAPGWYRGGQPKNPTRILKRWDRNT